MDRVELCRGRNGDSLEGLVSSGDGVKMVLISIVQTMLRDHQTLQLSLSDQPENKKWDQTITR